MTHDIKLEKFQGPLDLLLQLIELEKLNITEISLSNVTEQFLRYLEKISRRESGSPPSPGFGRAGALGGEVNRSEELADFLVIATRLVYLKSRTLLPYLYPEEDEGPSLADQLKMYQQYVEASKKINIWWNANRVAYGRVEPPVKPEGFVLPNNAHRGELHKAMLALVNRLQPINPLPQATIDRSISVKQKIDSLFNLLKQSRRFNFADILKGARNRTEVIVSFLALLELVKNEQAAIKQHNAFADIEVVRV